MQELQAKLRAIPGIDKLMISAASDAELVRYRHALLVRVLRQVAESLRAQLKQGTCVEISIESILDEARRRMRQIGCPSLRRVVNATGVVLHTNLGRAPLSERARARVTEIAEGYSTLEYDVATGDRGSRYSHVEGRICELVGAEAAIVVNNNAAAVLLVLSALAAGREVIVSRGQLVEIGGSFRVPEVLEQSGCKLVEVGTTNKTHLRDYEQAIGPDTAVILKVHTSNYRIVGFTAQPQDEDLVELARHHKLPLIEDLGSGTVISLKGNGWHEPAVGERLAAGMDIVTFSGDKLFGSGQAGIIAGKKVYIDKMRKHPLLRALRIDKLSLAALEGALLDYELGDPLLDIPVQKMLHVSLPELKRRAEYLAEMLHRAGFTCDEVQVASLESQAGGGSLPAVDLPGYGVALALAEVSAATVERILRVRQKPIIVRIHDNRVLFDVRCLADDDTAEISRACLELKEGAIR